MFVVPSGSVGHQRLQPIRGLVELVELKQDTVTGKVTSVTFCIQCFVFVCTCICVCVCVSGHGFMCLHMHGHRCVYICVWLHVVSLGFTHLQYFNISLMTSLLLSWPDGQWMICSFRWRWTYARARPHTHTHTHTTHTESLIEHSHDYYIHTSPQVLNIDKVINFPFPTPPSKESLQVLVLGN